MGRQDRIEQDTHGNRRARHVCGGIVGLTLFVLEEAGHRLFCFRGLFDCTGREATLISCTSEL